MHADPEVSARLSAVLPWYLSGAESPEWRNVLCGRLEGSCSCLMLRSPVSWQSQGRYWPSTSEQSVAMPGVLLGQAYILQALLRGPEVMALSGRCILRKK